MFSYFFPEAPANTSTSSAPFKTSATKVGEVNLVELSSNHAEPLVSYYHESVTAMVKALEVKPQNIEDCIKLQETLTQVVTWCGTQQANSAALSKAYIENLQKGITEKLGAIAQKISDYEQGTAQGNSNTNFLNAKLKQLNAELPKLAWSASDSLKLILATRKQEIMAESLTTIAKIFPASKPLAMRRDSESQAEIKSGATNSNSNSSTNSNSSGLPKNGLG